MTPMIRLTALTILPISLLISLTHLVGADRGPGDGFTGGIIAALGVTLQYVVFGYTETARRFRRIPFTSFIGIGLAVAFLAGLLPVLLGQSYLGLVEARFEVPAIGSIYLDRALLFDVGIYLVVLGASATVIDSLERVTT